MDLLPFIKEVIIRKRTETSIMSKLKEVEQYVQALNLEFNDFDTIPMDLCDYPNLKQLSLAFNNIAELNDEKLDKYLESSISELGSLNLKGNSIKTVPVSLFRHLTALNLSGNKITELPTIANISREGFPLQILMLSDNYISELPSSLISCFRQLIVLDLANNKLSSLPWSLRQCHNLKQLDLSGNPLDFGALEYVKCLSSLNSLNLANLKSPVTRLSTKSWIPQDISRLSHLTYLSLSGLQLGTCPPGIARMKSLRNLNLGRNQLANLTIFRFVASDYPRGLESLNLSTNKFSSDVFSDLENLTGLKSLKLDSNLIQEIPACFKAFTTLEKLSLNNNKIIRISSKVGHSLSRLKFLDVKNNPFEKDGIPYSLWEIPKLKVDSRHSPRRRLSISQIRQYVSSCKHSETLEEIPEFFEKFEISESFEVYKYKDIYDLILDIKSLDAPSVENTTDSRRSTLNLNEKLQLETRLKTHIESRNVCNVESSNSPEPRQGFKPSRAGINLDFSELFKNDFDGISGVCVYQAEEEPIRIFDEKFYSTKCYVVTCIFGDELEDKIYIWIGKDAKAHKKARAAIYSLGIKSITSVINDIERFEQGKESGDFLSLFQQFEVVDDADNDEARVMKKSNDDVEIFSVKDSRIKSLERVGPMKDSITPSGVYLIKSGNDWFLYRGEMASQGIVSKATLLSQELSRVKPVICNSLKEEWFTNGESNETIPERASILYQVSISNDRIHITQPIYSPMIQITSDYLDPHSVFILDTNIDTFLWIGTLASSKLKMIAPYIADFIFDDPERPWWAKVFVENQGAESGWFKLQFPDWHLSHDNHKSNSSDNHTKPALDMNLDAIFTNINPKTSVFAEILEDVWYDHELHNFKVFELDGNSWTDVDVGSFGCFKSQSTYAILCEYFINGYKIKPLIYCWRGSKADKYDSIKFKLNRELFQKQNSLNDTEIIIVNQYEEPLLLLYHFPMDFMFDLDMSDSMLELWKLKKIQVFDRSFWRISLVDFDSFIPCSENVYCIKNSDQNYEKMFLWIGNHFSSSDKDLQSIYAIRDALFPNDEYLVVHQDEKSKELSFMLNKKESFWENPSWDYWNPRYFLLTVENGKVCAREKSDIRISYLEDQECAIMDPIGKCDMKAENCERVPIYYWVSDHAEALSTSTQEGAYIYSVHYSEKHEYESIRPVLQAKRSSCKSFPTNIKYS